MADVWLGSEIGFLKGVDLKNSSFTNYSVSPTLSSNKSRVHEICAMCWADDEENEICLGLATGAVKTFNVTKNEFVSEQNYNLGEGKLKGLLKWNDSVVTCVESGLLKIWSSDSEPTEIKVGVHVSAMRQNPIFPSQVGTGGKSNDLKLWDLSRPDQPIFRAKNVPNDSLDLQVPIWVTDLGFLPNQGSQSKIAVGTGYHQVRLYDTKAQRRPVLSFDFGETPVTALAVTNSENVVIVGNTIGTMGNIDLRKGELQGHYKGFAGGIRCISCLSKQAMVASCGLDRFLRIHHLHSRKLLHKVYLKSVLNCLLFSSKEIEKQSSQQTASKDSVAKSNSSRKRTAEEELSGDEDDIWSKMDVIASSFEKRRKQKPKNTSKKKERAVSSDTC